MQEDVLLIPQSFFCISQAAENGIKTATPWNHIRQLRNQIFHPTFRFPTKCPRDYLQKERDAACSQENFDLPCTTNP